MKEDTAGPCKRKRCSAKGAGSMDLGHVRGRAARKARTSPRQLESAGSFNPFLPGDPRAIALCEHTNRQLAIHAFPGTLQVYPPTPCTLAAAGRARLPRPSGRSRGRRGATRNREAPRCVHFDAGFFNPFPLQSLPTRAQLRGSSVCPWIGKRPGDQVKDGLKEAELAATKNQRKVTARIVLRPGDGSKSPLV
jgi:hypothetical protein